MTDTPLPRTDEIRQAELTYMRRLATSLLGAALLVFIVARIFEAQYPWLGYVRATAEAGVIGGLADWFAVTALFRHPLGIPIPHTAIVPARKDQVGRTLGGFVERHFLAPQVIGARLRSARVAEHLLTWIADPVNAHHIAQRAAKALATAVSASDHDGALQEVIAERVTSKIERTPVAPMLAKALGLVTTDNKHQELFDEAIKVLSKGLSKNRDFIRERIDQETPWWMPEQVDEAIAAKIVRAIDRTLKQIKDNPQHPMRERFDTSIHEFIERLNTSPEVIARAEAMKHEILNAEMVRGFSSGLWDDLRAALIRTAENPDARALETVAHGVTAIATGVKEDPELLAKLEDWMIEAVTELVERYRGEVAILIAETVDGWDPQMTSRRIELAVGADLQYVRINGTLVGGLAGLVIYTIMQFF